LARASSGAVYSRRRVVFPAESALLRLVGEQKKLAHESIVTRIADSFSPEMAETINRLLDIQPGETVSALQKIKANPAKSSAPAMNALMHKMAAIEATGILGINLSWLNANFHAVRGRSRVFFGNSAASGPFLFIWLVKFRQRYQMRHGELT